MNEKARRMPRSGGVRIYVLAVGLMWVGGFVDAFGFLTLRHVYLGNMSGDTGEGRRGAGEWRLVRSPHLRGSILSFGTGLLVGALIQDVARRLGVRRLLALTLSVEAACLAAVWALPRPVGGTRVFLGAAAMGIQNTSLRNSGLLSLYTTHVTGLLTELTEQLAALLAGVLGVDHVRASDGSGRAAGVTPVRGDPAAASWLTVAYAVWLTGAVASSAIMSRGRAVLAFPLVIVVAAAAADAIQPLSHATAAERSLRQG